MYLNISFSILTLLLLLRTCNGRAKQVCKSNSDCPINSSCEAGQVCFCNSGYIDVIETSLRCLKEATHYGDYCERSIQCTALLGLRAHCKHDKSGGAIGTCVCQPNSHFKEGICHKNSDIGGKCVVSSDCMIANSELNAYCEREKCVCPPGHVPSQDNKDCLPFSGLGERCEGNTTCIVPESKCQEYCQCRIGFVPSKDNKRCLPAADSVDDACEEDAQCMEFLKLSRCDHKVKKCACQPSTHRLDDQCWLDVELEGLCEHNLECYTPGDRSSVECRGGFCLCKKGFTSSGKTCININKSGFQLRSGCGVAKPLIVERLLLSLGFLMLVVNSITQPT